MYYQQVAGRTEEVSGEPDCSTKM